MKLLSWNIQWGRGIDGNVNLGRIIEAAQALLDFDVLCLQEVAAGFQDLPGLRGADHFAALPALLPGFQVYDGAAVERSGPQGRCRFGNVLATRLPVDVVVRHGLPWESDSTENMPRMAIEAVIQTDVGPLRLVTTHLEWSSERTRWAQVEALRDIHRRGCERSSFPPRPGLGPARPMVHTPSTILVGDLNMTPDHPALERLQDGFGQPPIPALRDAWRALHPDKPHPVSFFLFEPEREPPRCVDFALLSENLIPRLVRIEYDQTSTASDHQPILLELR
jgi:endonuclease/exonuclease/phosphatase family metal-dependent hydrolase